MYQKEKISIKNFEDKKFKIAIEESKKDAQASFTHYLHNHGNGVSQFYKSDAIGLPIIVIVSVFGIIFVCHQLIVIWIHLNSFLMLIFS